MRLRQRRMRMKEENREERVVGKDNKVTWMTGRRDGVPK